MSIKIPKDILIPRTKECNDFITWFEQARPGEIYTYYRGDNLNYENYNMIIGELLWNFACKGKVYLFQRRMGVNDFEYIGMKVGLPIQKLIPKTSAYEQNVWNKRKTKINIERASLNG